MFKYSVPIGGGTSIAGHYANRHGLIAGATGTGKTVTLMTLAEGFSAIGVPVFVVDAKSDLAALTRSTPYRMLDAFGEQGDAATLNVKRLGPDLLSRLLSLSDAQTGVLSVVFAVAEKQRLPLATLQDLKAVLSYVGASAKQIGREFGYVTPATLAAIRRGVLGLEADNAAKIFSATPFDIVDLMTLQPDGRGLVSILAGERIMRSPSLYAAFMLSVLRDLFERLSEVGDLDKPRLVLFIDEAHMLFQGTLPALLQRIEMTIRLIRSKGVGVYFVTQSPSDIPPIILGQLGNRVQHALRGATVADQKAIRAAAETLPINPKIEAARMIGTMGVGHALVSTVSMGGVPSPVQCVRVNLPRCPLGPLAPHERYVTPAVRVAPNTVDTANLAFNLACLAIVAAGAGVLFWIYPWTGILTIAAGAWLALRNRM